MDNFWNLQLYVKEQEKKTITAADEDRLFSKLEVYLKKPFTLIGIFTLEKLAFIPPTISSERLERIANIICKTILNSSHITGDDISCYADFCKGFGYLQGVKNDVRISFDQILISTFLNELEKNVGYEKRLNQLLENRNIPQEKKSKWIGKKIQEQQQVFDIITLQSIIFLNKLFQLYPEIVYRVIEFLLIQMKTSYEKNAFKYLCSLLKTVKFGSVIEFKVTDINKIKLEHWKKFQHETMYRVLGEPIPNVRRTLTPLFESIKTLCDYDSFTQEIREDIYFMIDSHPHKENFPQDYIKYSIKYLLGSQIHKLNDFFIDDDENYDCNVCLLESKDFSDYRRSKMVWNGLKVKLLKRKIKNEFSKRIVEKKDKKRIQWKNC